MNKNVCGLKNIKLLLHVYNALVSVHFLKDEVMKKSMFILKDVKYRLLSVQLRGVTAFEIFQN